MTTPDPCTHCQGHGGAPAVLAEAEDFRISRGWVSCQACEGTGDGVRERRVAARRELDGTEEVDDG